MEIAVRAETVYSDTMLLGRQKLLLALVDALGGNVCNLDFQKFLLLYCGEVEDAPTYEFVPHEFGGFSFTSYADKRRLMDPKIEFVVGVTLLVKVGKRRFARVTLG